MSGGRRITLDVALLHCESLFGASWVYAPGRWQTGDGCVPVRIAWAMFSATSTVRARFALDTARGIGLALGGKEGLTNSAMDEAFPG